MNSRIIIFKKEADNMIERLDVIEKRYNEIVLESDKIMFETNIKTLVSFVII